MWTADIDKMKEFKTRVGDDHFGELTSGPNSNYWGDARKLVEGEE